MKKRWFDDCQIAVHHIDDNKAVLSIFLPNSQGKHTHFELFEGQEVEVSDINELAAILGSAFDQIQTDNGGYKK